MDILNLTPKKRLDIKLLPKGEYYRYLILPDNTIKVVNYTAYEILELCDGKRTVKEIINRVANNYAIDFDSIMKDIIEFVMKAMDLGVIELYECK